MTPLLRIAGLWRDEAPLLLAGAFLALISVLAAAAVALSAGAVPLAAGMVVLLAVRGLGVARVGLRYLERLVTHAATFRALAALRVWMFRGLARRSAGGLGFMRRGDALARLVSDIEALDGLYLRILVPLGAAAVLLPVLAAVLGRHDPLLATAVCLLFAASILAIPAWAARSSLAAGAGVTEAASGLRVATVDALGGMREVRAFGNEGRMLALIQARESALFSAGRALARNASLAQAAAALCAQAALLLVLLADLPVQALLPAVLLTVAAFEVGAMMPRAGALAGQAAAASARVLDLGPAGVPAPGRAAPSGTGLRFDKVRFAWPGRPPILEGLSLDIPPGARVAILGPSGSGKSTLAALALKVVEPQSGRVLLGGVDLVDVAADAARHQIAWLAQGTHVFADTVRANLLLGRPGADDAALWQALSQAGLAETVSGLADGLETWIGEGGAGLSGGQLRRVALARALLSAAPILVLDEPATGLDDAAERAFLTTLNEAAADRTVVLIVHRLLGVERLDRIWRLSGGVAVAAAG